MSSLSRPNSRGGADPRVLEVAVASLRDQAPLIDLDSNYEQIRTGCYQRTRIYPRHAGKPGIDPLAGAAPGGVNIGNDPGQDAPAPFLRPQSWEGLRASVHPSLSCGGDLNFGHPYGARTTGPGEWVSFGGRVGGAAPRILPIKINRNAVSRGGHSHAFAGSGRDTPGLPQGSARRGHR